MQPTRRKRTTLQPLLSNRHLGLLLCLILGGPGVVFGADPPATATEPTGTVHWLARRRVGRLQQTLHLDLTRHADGSWTGQLFTTDQAVTFPVKQVSVNGAVVTIEFAGTMGRFSGRVAEDSQSIRGVWQHQGQSEELQFFRDQLPTEPAALRPQTPMPPFPYRVAEVRIPNRRADISLSATVTYPATANAATDPQPIPEAPPGSGNESSKAKTGSGKKPTRASSKSGADNKSTGATPTTGGTNTKCAAVVFVAGTRPTDRDLTAAAHQPFWVLADHLTRQGFVVVRYDGRGLGQSTGNYRTAVLRDFTDDANVVWDWLRTQPWVDPNRVGFLGHGEGGLIAGRAANASPETAFLILLACPALPATEVYLTQTRLQGEQANSKPNTLAQLLHHRQRLLEVVRQEEDPRTALEQLKVLHRTYLEQHAPEGEVSSERLEAELLPLVAPGFVDLLRYEPAADQQRWRCPTLALYGQKDREVWASDHLPALAQHLAKSSCPHYSLQLLPDLNHRCQTAQTGSRGEYSTITETVAPRVLQVLSDWLQTLPPRVAP